MVFSAQARKTPLKVIKRGRVFRFSGRVGWRCGLRRVQFKAAPPAIAPPVRSIIGRDMLASSSWIWCIGAWWAGLQVTDAINRREYSEVIAVAVMAIKIIEALNGQCILYSRIISFE